MRTQMSDEFLKHINPTVEQFGAWRQSPIGKIFFEYCKDRAEALIRDATELWLATGELSEEQRGRILELREIATPTLDMIHRFYSMETSDDERRPTGSDRADAVSTGDLYR